MAYLRTLALFLLLALCSAHATAPARYTGKRASVVFEPNIIDLARLGGTTGSASKVNPFHSSTRRLGAESGLLYYYGYRYYESRIGNWLSRDPLGESGGLNLYGFLGNDPVNNWDYLGLSGYSIQEIKVAYLRLYGAHDPLYLAFFASGHKLAAGDVGGDNISSGQIPFTANHLLKIEEDVDSVMQGALLMRAGLLEVLGKDHQMREEFSSLADDDDPLAQFDITHKQYRSALGNIGKTLDSGANLAMLAARIINEPADMVASFGEVLGGDPAALVGLLPLVPGSVVSHARRTRTLDQLGTASRASRSGHRITALATANKFDWNNARRSVKEDVIAARDKYYKMHKDKLGGVEFDVPKHQMPGDRGVYVLESSVVRLREDANPLTQLEEFFHHHQVIRDGYLGVEDLPGAVGDLLEEEVEMLFIRLGVKYK